MCYLVSKPCATDQERQANFAVQSPKMEAWNLALFMLRSGAYLLQSGQSVLSEGGQRGQQSGGWLGARAPVLQLQHSACPPAPALSAASWLPAFEFYLLHITHCH